MTRLTQSQLKQALANGAHIVEKRPYLAKKAPRAHKYNARRASADGHTFDSQAEQRRYLQLRTLANHGVIRDLVLQPRYALLDGFTDNTGKRQRPIVYVADFAYTDRDGRRVVEDVKGVETAVFRMKKKMFLARYPELHLEIVR